MNRFSVAAIRTVAVMLLLVAPVQLFASSPVSYDDPWEGMNRRVFQFNDWVDTYTLKPVAKGYDFVTPKPVQGLIGNFFSNLGEVRNAASAGLQLKGKDALVSTGRLLINSTIGMLGLIDVATPLGLEQRYSDFGLAFASWGAPSGPYVVLPFLGPYTARSGIGLVPDMYTNPLSYHDQERERLIARGVDIINTRARLLDAEELIVGDRYTFIKDSYLQRRAFLITGEQPEDDF